MKRTYGLITLLFGALVFAWIVPAFGQANDAQTSAEPGAPTRNIKANKRYKEEKRKRARGPGKEMASGGGDVGKGAAKGAGDLGKGAAGGAGNLVTGHPVNATVSVGKGVGGAAKNVGVGAGKGVGKIGKGVGGEFKKIGHKKRAKRSEGDAGE